MTGKDENQAPPVASRNFFGAIQKLIEPQLEVLQKQLDRMVQAANEDEGSLEVRAYVDDALIKYTTAIAAIKARASITAAQAEATALSVLTGRKPTAGDTEAQASAWLDKMRDKTKAPAVSGGRQKPKE